MDRLEIAHVTVPAGTAQSAAVTTPLTFADGVVTEVEIIVPPGPRGLSGFQIRYDNVPQLPRTPGQFVITDNEPIRWPVDNLPTGSHWQFHAYNTDIYDHTYEVRFLIDEIRIEAVRSVRLVAIAQPDQPADAPEDATAPQFQDVSS